VARAHRAEGELVCRRGRAFRFGAAEPRRERQRDGRRSHSRDSALRDELALPIEKLLLRVLRRRRSGTDHSSFRPAFLATGVTEGYTSDDTTPYYHTAGDTDETVKFAYLRSTTTLVNRVMADLSR
jgi:hypothetical protein